MDATITITLPSELERVIAGRATASGKKLEEYALDVLRRDAELSDVRELFADVRDQIEASGISDEGLDDKIEAAIARVRARRRDAETAAWINLSAQGLAAAYGDDEPEYSLTLLKESNPEYERG